MTEILFEKYRPQTFNEIISNNEINAEIEATVNSGSIPHLLFYGRAGIGKTTMAHVIKNRLFELNVLSKFLEINASDERGIDTIRDKVKTFARTGNGNKDQFKICFLDEADAITNDGQNALRRIMEKYQKNCRFILSCNRISEIIEPIQSRCTIYGFKPINKIDGINQLQMINNKENGNIEEDYLEAIFNKSNGDMRKCINTLQSSLNGSHRKLSEVFNIDTYDRIIEAIMFGNLRQPLIDLNELTEDPRDIVLGLYESVFKKDLDCSKEFYIALGELDRALISGGIPKIQFAWFVNKV